jgi:hypothetical protein
MNEVACLYARAPLRVHHLCMLQNTEAMYGSGDYAKKITCTDNKTGKRQSISSRCMRVSESGASTVF